MDADIDLFVREKATGNARPVSVPYINFYHPSDNLGGSGETGVNSVSCHLLTFMSWVEFNW